MLIFNPAAGQLDARRDLERAVALLASRGWRIALAETTLAGSATETARAAAASGQEVVLVAGGDGNLNEVVNRLVGSEVALGVLPVGTANVWAREIGMPTAAPLVTDLLPAARALAEGRIYRIDVGRAGGRHFLLCAGVGFDGWVTREVRPEIKRRLGPLAFVPAALGTAARFAGSRVMLSIDGRRLARRALLVEVANAQLYAAIARLSPEACLDDGRLDISIFVGQGVFYLARHIFRVLTHRHLRDPHIERYLAQQVTIRSRMPLPVQVDGEPSGTTPIAIQVVPRALRVIVPRRVRPGLLRGRPEVDLAMQASSVAEERLWAKTQGVCWAHPGRV